MNEHKDSVKSEFVRMVDGLQDAMAVYMVSLIKLTTFLSTVLDQNQIPHRNLVDHVFTIKNSLLFDEEVSYEYNISNDVAMTRNMITNFLRLSCNHIHSILSDYREYFAKEFTSELINFVDLSLSEENTNVLNSAYKVTCKSIYKFSAIQKDIFERLSVIYRPLAIYENFESMFEDNARLCIYLQAAVERWLQYKISCEELRRVNLSKNVCATLRRLSFQKKFYKANVVSNAEVNVIWSGLETYANKLNSSALLNASIPACFHAYPELFASMLPKSAKPSAIQIIKFPINNFHNVDGLKKFIKAELTNIQVDVSSDMVSYKFYLKELKEEERIGLTKHVYDLVKKFIDNSQNHKILSYQNQAQMLTHQILSLVCPSISVYCSYFAVLFLYGVDTDSLLEILLDESSLPVASISLLLDTVTVSVVCDWTVRAKHKCVGLSSFEVKISTEFKILVNAHDVVSSSLHFLPVVNTAVKHISCKR